MLSTEQKRQIIADYYNSDSYSQKLKTFSDAKIHMIYMRLLNDGKIR